ncbi:unnamed protein product, partial [Musa textilis]
QKSNGRGAAQDHNDEPPFGIRGRGTAQDPEIQWSRRRSRP